MEGESELRKRRSLLASLEQIGRREEEEEVEEFQLPQREDDSGFSVNKCILGALILLGLGTIFFSGRHITKVKVSFFFFIIISSIIIIIIIFFGMLFAFLKNYILMVKA